VHHRLRGQGEFCHCTGDDDLGDEIAVFGLFEHERR
jgi:hypothetical protein